MKQVLFVVFLLVGANAFGLQVPEAGKDPRAFIPDGYVVFDEIQGDLNSDGEMDYVFIIKENKVANFVKNRFGEEVDRNRRGIIVAFHNEGQYDLVLENRDCFLSDNEDGGVYFPPYLSVSVENGSLLLHYSHGRYGYWVYNFRYQNSGFELIGYDRSSNRGPVVEHSISVNLMTRRLRIRENINPDAEGGDEVFKETWEKFTLPRPIKLKEIADFYGFDVRDFLRPVK